MAGKESKSRPWPKRLVRSRAQATGKSLATARRSRIPNATGSLDFSDLLRDCLAVGVVLIDAKRHVTSLNSQARTLLGLSPRQAPLPSLAALPPALQALVQRAWSSGKASTDRQVQLGMGDRAPVHPPQFCPPSAAGARTARGPGPAPLPSTSYGGRVTLQASAVPTQPGRKHSSVVLVLNDLTPVRQIEQHIQQLDRLASIGTLAAGIAHEIKNALVAGKTFVDLLLEKHKDAELVEVVRREMARIDALVSRMRRFAGPDRPAFSEVRLHDILDQSLRLIQPQVDNKQVSVNRSFLASPDMLHGDDYQLQQAFVNLFLNAVEAMGPNGTLSVATSLLPTSAVPVSTPKAAPGAQLPSHDPG